VLCLEASTVAADGFNASFDPVHSSKAELRSAALTFGLYKLVGLETLLWQRALKGTTFEAKRSAASSMILSSLMPHAPNMGSTPLFNATQESEFTAALVRLEQICHAAQANVVFVSGPAVDDWEPHIRLKTSAYLAKRIKGMSRLHIGASSLGKETAVVSGAGARTTIVSAPAKGWVGCRTGTTLLLPSRP